MQWIEGTRCSSSTTACNLRCLRNYWFGCYGYSGFFFVLLCVNLGWLPQSSTRCMLVCLSLLMHRRCLMKCLRAWCHLSSHKTNMIWSGRKGHVKVFCWGIDKSWVWPWCKKQKSDEGCGSWARAYSYLFSWVWIRTMEMSEGCCQWSGAHVTKWGCHRQVTCGW